MLRIGIPREPYDVPLPYGVVFRCRPLNTAVMEAAQAEAVQRLDELRTEVLNRREAGVELDGLPDLEDPAACQGHAKLMLIKALARYAIIDWQGVYGPDDQPAPVTPQTIAEVIENWPPVASSFYVHYTSHIDALAREGNASRPAPPGTSVAGPDTAPSATPTTSPAPEAAADRADDAAPTRSTGRARSKATKPGSC